MLEEVRKMKALLTGGAGFIGSHVCDELIERGWEVVILDNLCIGEKQNVNPKAEFVEGDIRDAETVNYCMRGVDTVFHFAYDATECKSIFSPVLDTDINLFGSMVVLKEAINAGVKNFVFPSSVLVYGKPQILPIPETHPRIPDDPYSVSKMAFEDYLRVYHELGKINPYIVRFNNTYGPRLRVDNPFKGATQIFISRCLQGKNPTVFGDGSQTRAFTFVEDIKKPIVECIDHNELINNPINIGSDCVHSIKEVAETIIKLTNPSLKLEYLPKRKKDIDHAYCDVSKMQKLFNYKCNTNMEEGLKKTIEWARGRRIKFKYDWPIEIPSLVEETYVKRKI